MTNVIERGSRLNVISRLATFKTNASLEFHNL